VLQTTSEVIIFVEQLCQGEQMPRYGPQEDIFRKTGRMWREKSPTAFLVAVIRRIGWEFTKLYRATLQRWIFHPLSLRWHRATKGALEFHAGGKSYKLFFHPYNNTWRNERMVEVPLIRSLLDGNPEARILEIGNVMSYYLDVDYDIVDKFEQNERVTNTDVVDFRPQEKYDLIISISTLEHVGFDEDPSNPEKVLAALDNLRMCLNPGGTLAATFPVGYNDYLDNLVFNGELDVTRYVCLLRTGKYEWREVKLDELRDVRYNKPYENGNGLIVFCIEA
jgi:hypothetical protein